MRTFWASPVVLLACSPVLPAPTITSVEPNVAFNGEDTPILITGEQFYPVVEIANEDAGSLQTEIEGWIEEAGGTRAPLLAMELQDYTHISGVVPALVSEGVYTLAIEMPSGQIARIDPFTVTSSPAQSLAIDGTTETPLLGEAALSIRLLDADGDLVSQTLPIRISVQQGGPDLVFCGDCLADTRIEGTGIAGLLDGGEAEVTFRMAEGQGPSNVVLLIESTDPLLAAALGVVSHSVNFTASEVADVELVVRDVQGEVLETGAAITAGDLLSVELLAVDAGGNGIPEANGTVTLLEACSDRVLAVVDVPRTTPVSGLQLTDASCDTTAILAMSTNVGGLDLTDAPATSLAFVLTPGPADRFEVETDDTVLTSGVAPVHVRVTAFDAYDNRAVDHQDTLSFRLTSAEVQGWTSFEPRQVMNPSGWVDGQASWDLGFCPGESPDVSTGAVEAEGTTGITGATDTFYVTDGPTFSPIVLQVDGVTQTEETTTEVYAGVDVPVSITFDTALGHPVIAALPALVISSNIWALEGTCHHDATSATGTHVTATFACTFQTPGTGTLTVRLDDYCIYETSGLIHAQ